jgi:hopanoid C-3 methylase
MKILLVQPPLNKKLAGGGTLYLNEPLALETVAAGVENEHEVRILDMRLSPVLDEALENFKPDIFGITAYTPDVYIVKALLQKAKLAVPGIKTIVGGHHASLFPEDFNTEFCDFIVLGEGQAALKELVEAFAFQGTDLGGISGLAFRNGGKLVFTSERKITDLDKIKIPARGLTKEYRNRYFRGAWRPVASLMTSRGCPYKCNFCSVWKRENGSYLVCSAERVVEELLSIEEEYISIADDNFLQDVKRAREIHRLIVEKNIKKKYKLIGRTDTIVKNPDLVEKWKQIGTEQIFLGLESFRDDDINKFNKTTTIKINNEAIRILHDNGVGVVGQFIISPDFLKEDFEALGDYVLKMRLSQPIFSVLTPLPGTDLHDQRKGEILTDNYEFYDLVHCVVPTRLPRKLFYQYYADLFLKCYSDSIGGGSLPKVMIEKLYNEILVSHALN